MAENTFVEESQDQKTASPNPDGPSTGPETVPPSRGEGYLGSVRFFKHLILTVLALCILVPTVLSVVFGVSLGRTKVELTKLQQSIRQPQPASLEAGGQTGGDSEPGDSQPGDEGPKPELPAYQALYPELYAQPAERNSVDEEKVVYLTFDDGPSERTPELLEVLEDYDIKATFFVVGKDTETARQWMRDIVEAGHTIGVHSYSHDYDTIYSSVEAYLEDFAREYDLIKDATGVAPQIFRFPGGSINTYNGHTYQEIISEMTRRGFVYFDWNRQTGDAVRGDVPARKLVENALERASSMRRVFLLSHDNTRFTNVVEALPQIIEGYQKEGFSFAPLTPEVKPAIYYYPD